MSVKRATAALAGAAAFAISLASLAAVRRGKLAYPAVSMLRTTRGPVAQVEFGEAAGGEMLQVATRRSAADAGVVGDLGSG